MKKDFGSDRSSRSHNLCFSGPKLSIAFNLDLSGSVLQDALSVKYCLVVLHDWQALIHIPLNNKSKSIVP